MPDQPVLTVIDAHESSRESLMAHVAGELRAKALVGESFLPALLDRETTFPTGVDFGRFRIAIPHIDPEHVRTPGLVVCRNDRAVGFQAMDDPARTLEVRLTVWPLVTDAENQVGLLATMLGLLQQDGTYQTLLTASPEEVAEVIAAALAATTR